MFIGLTGALIVLTIVSIVWTIMLFDDGHTDFGWIALISTVILAWGSWGFTSAVSYKETLDRI